MQKITLKALELAGFQNADKIAEIISYVPNPQVATEMLLGIYTPKTVDVATSYRKHKYSSYEIMAEITGYDDLGDKVFYTQYEPLTKEVYYLTKEDRENKVYVEERPKDYYTSGTVKTPGVKIKENQETSTSDFEETFSKQLSIHEASNIFNDWRGDEIE